MSQPDTQQVKQINTVLTARDGSASVAVSHEIPMEEWGRLLEFRALVERLRSTKFVQMGKAGKTLLFTPEGTISDPAISFDDIGSMLLRLRPFVLQQKEDYNFDKIRNLLKRRLDHTAWRHHLDVIGQKFRLVGINRSVQFVLADKKLPSVELVMDWLNAYEYHRDPDKRRSVEQALGVFANSQDGQPVILFALTEMIEAIMILDGFVSMLQKIVDGSMQSVPCPTEYLTDS